MTSVLCLDQRTPGPISPITYSLGESGGLPVGRAVCESGCAGVACFVYAEGGGDWTGDVSITPTFLMLDWGLWVLYLLARFKWRLTIGVLDTRFVLC